MLPRIMITKGLISVMLFILLSLTFTSVDVAAENEIMKRNLQERLQQSVQSDVYVELNDFCNPFPIEMSLEVGKTYNLKYIGEHPGKSEIYLSFENAQDNPTLIDIALYFPDGYGYYGIYNWDPNNWFIGSNEFVIKVHGPNPLELIIPECMAMVSIEEIAEEALTKVMIGPGESYILHDHSPPIDEPYYGSSVDIMIESEGKIMSYVATYSPPILGEVYSGIEYHNTWSRDRISYGGSAVVTNVSSSPVLVYGPKRSISAEKSDLPAHVDSKVFPGKIGVLKHSSEYESTVRVLVERGQEYEYKIFNADNSLHEEGRNGSIGAYHPVPKGGKLIVFNTRSNKPIKIIGDYLGYHEQSYRTLDFYVQKGFNSPVKIEDFEAIQFLAGPYEHNMYINLPVNAEEDMVENVDYIIFNDSIWYSVDQLRANGVNFTIEDEYVQMNVTDEGLIGRIDNPGSIITTYSTCAPSCDYSIFLFSGVNTESPMWDEAGPVIRNQFSTGNKQVAIHQYHPFGLADGLEGRKRLQFIGLQLVEFQNLRHGGKPKPNHINFIKQNISGGKVVLVGHSAGGIASYRVAVILESEDEILIGNVVAVGSPKWYLPLSDINDKFIYIESLYDRLTGGEWGLVRAPAHSLIIELDPETRDTFFGDHAYYFRNLPWTDSEGNARNNVVDTIDLIYEYTN